MEPMLIAIDAIRISNKRRKGISPRRVEELRQTIERDNDSLPVRLNALGDGTFTVRDGRHRLKAYKNAGHTLILAFVENLDKITHSILRLAQKLLMRFRTSLHR